MPANPSKSDRIKINFFHMGEKWHKQSKNKNDWRDFPGGAVVKNPPASAGDMGSSPGPGRSDRPRSN